VLFSKQKTKHSKIQRLDFKITRPLVEDRKAFFLTFKSVVSSSPTISHFSALYLKLLSVTHLQLILKLQLSLKESFITFDLCDKQTFALVVS